MSIQCELDGHSFSCDTGAAASLSAQMPVPVEVLTVRTALVPEALFAERDACLWLTAEGKQPLHGECVVCSAPQEGVVALMALPEAALQQLRDTFGADATFAFTSPLADNLTPTDPQIPHWNLSWHHKYLYVQVLQGGLQLAEVMQASSEEDILWLIAHLNKTFPTREYLLTLRGEELRKLRKGIASRFKFKKIVCA